MQGFVLTRKAKDDLRAIGHYTQETWGHKQRNRYLTMLDEKFQALSADPMKGLDCSAIREGYRKYEAGKHIIFYRKIENGFIEIVRVLHGRMDIPTRLSDSTE
jgi:toxin ParE1/3/4